MAYGDAAAAAGLYVEPGTKDLNEGFDGINIRGDEIAAEMAARAAADALKLDKTKVLIQATAMTAGTAVGTLRFW